MKLPGLSIRGRISIGSVLIAAVLFSSAAFFFRLEVQSILIDTTETLLSNDAAPIVADLVRNPTESIDAPTEGQLIAVVDPGGELRRSSLPRSLNNRLDDLATIGEHPQAIDTGNTRYLVASTTVVTDTGNWVIITARNEEALSLLLDELTRVLTIGTIVLTVGFGLASWLLTGAALRPVNRLRAEAESLSTAGASAHLLIPAGNDEVSRLAITLNDFIGRLRRGVDREKQVVSDASHELRTPLAVLKSQLELARLNSGDAPALERDIADASVTVDRLARLATNLLELSKLEGQQPPPETNWGGLVAEISASVDRARLVRNGADLDVDYLVDGDDPDGRYAISPTNVGQLVDNLVSNSVSAMHGKGAVMVTLHRAGNEAVLTVLDSGPGMPDGFIPVAFDRFSRPEHSRAGGGTGSGLGLAIVHAIVDRARGTISLRNTGSGLAVKVGLPRRTPEP
ncbi:sensor histidine kinase [Cryobacterium fucosi]|uniref:histidine kinase n=1 Tax=Cryobacterium fucosi TaxID=1259157 RepID=A0A4R9B8A1_9MICO|nr:HAMP domain-containing sensor histidine kinase [Cryobacterium fucosi]TFD77668.1 HAMP domain-containing histidine kinase [Cryobacterium fucosi]